MPRIKEKKYVTFPTKAQAMLWVRTNPYAIEDLEERWRDDKEVMMVAVSAHGLSLEFASDRLKADKELVLAAIENDPRSLSYASRELRDDFEIRKIAYKTSIFIVDPIAWKVFERDDARMIRETVKTQKVVENGKTRYEHVFDELGEPVFSEEKTFAHPVYNKYKDFYNGNMSVRQMMLFEKQLIAETIKTVDEAIEFLSTEDGARSFQYLPDKIREDRDVALKAVSMRGANLFYCAEELKENQAIVNAAIEQDPYALIYAAEKFRNDLQYRKRAYEKVGFFVVDPDLRKAIIQIEKNRTSGRVRRVKKEFKNKEEYERFFINEVLAMVAAQMTREDQMLVEEGRRATAREFKVLEYENLSAELLMDFEFVLLHPRQKQAEGKRRNASRMYRAEKVAKNLEVPVVIPEEVVEEQIEEVVEEINDQPEDETE